MHTFTDFAINIKITDRADLEHQLDQAVALAQSTAMHDRRRGILVTRHDYGTFTVKLSDAVAFGTTREHQEL